MVASRLSRLLLEGYEILHDVILPARDGTTTQIDHIVVSRYGIFVIETKDYSGQIYGGDKRREWTQAFRVGWKRKEKYRLQNPILQNWRHVYVMSDLLKFPLRYFKNVVVFCGDAEFRTEMPENVVDVRDLVDYIKAFDEQVLPDSSVRKVCSAIAAWSSTVTDERRNEHVAKLKSRHDPIKMSVAFEKGELKCPRCGSKMVLRHRHSDGHAFYGCSRYPNCKGIMDVSTLAKSV